MALYPSLGRRKFFQELDSSATSTTGGTERRPWPAISAASLGSILGRRRGHGTGGRGGGHPGVGVFVDDEAGDNFSKSGSIWPRDESASEIFL